MKILVISRGYPTEKYPMNGIFEFDQAKALAGLGHEVIFAAIDMRSIRRTRKWGIEKFEKEGIKVYGINFPIGRVPKNILSLFSIAGLKKLYPIIEREQGKPDIMHSHFTGISYTATKLKEITNIPLVMTEHSSEMMKPQIDDNLKHKASKTYPHGDKIITVSPALSDIIKSNFNIDNVYIPNIVDTNIFKYRPREKKDKFIFITVGGLIYRKRMDLTVQAFAETFKDNENLELIVVGEGEERKKIEDMIKANKLEGKVKLTGRLTRDKIAELMLQSNCFVLPSRAETFGVVYIEAMATGLPVIGSRCGGPEGFINESNGLMIEVDNLEELKSSMKYMYENIDKYDNEKIATETYRQFSPEGVAKLIVEQYEEVLRGRDK